MRIIQIHAANRFGQCHSGAVSAILAGRILTLDPTDILRLPGFGAFVARSGDKGCHSKRNAYAAEEGRV